MATTSTKLAIECLLAIGRSGLPYTLLHGAEKLTTAEQSLSDLDVAIGLPSPERIEALFKCLAEAGLRPLISWRYDISAATLFLLTEDMRDGVQLDLLFAPTGRGKYGLRTDRLLSDSGMSGAVSVVSELDSWLYQIRKRRLKDQHDRVRALLEDPPSPRALALSRSDELFVGHHRTIMRQLLASEVGKERWQPDFIAQMFRRAGRALRPAGVWIHFSGGERAVAEELHHRVSSVVACSTLFAYRRDSFSGLRTALSTVARAGVAVSYGGARVWAGPRVVLDPPDPYVDVQAAADSASRAVMRQRHQRAERMFRLHMAALLDRQTTRT